MPKLVLIVAIAENGVIGSGNDLPWGRSLPRDMARFRELTLKVGCVLMGRKTALSLPKPLPKRRNLVLSRSGADLPAGFEVYTTLQDAIAAAGDIPAIAVIGGSEIYKLCAPHASLAYITRVRTAFKGDAFFDVAMLDSYTRKGELLSFTSDPSNKHAMQFITLQNDEVKPL